MYCRRKKIYEFLMIQTYTTDLTKTNLQNLHTSYQTFLLLCGEIRNNK